MGTKFKGSKAERQALNTLIKLMRCSNSVMAVLRKELQKEGLTISQLGVLEALFHLGPMCQNELGQKLLKTGGNITTVIDNLEKSGYIVRKKVKSDRRSYEIHLTDSGKDKISEYFPAHIKKIKQVMSVLDLTEQKALETILKKLGLGVIKRTDL
jgi:MarR family 2-MHQ and catechol resistance regulon transcriptional repressor